MLLSQSPSVHSWVVPELLFLPVNWHEWCLGRVWGNSDSLLALWWKPVRLRDVKVILFLPGPNNESIHSSRIAPYARGAAFNNACLCTKPVSESRQGKWTSSSLKQRRMSKVWVGKDRGLQRGGKSSSQTASARLFRSAQRLLWEPGVFISWAFAIFNLSGGVMQGERWQTEDLMFHRALSSFVNKQVSGFCILFLPSFFFFFLFQCRWKTHFAFFFAWI